MDKRLRLKLPKLVLKMTEGVAAEDSEEAAVEALEEAAEEAFEEVEDVVIVKVDLEVDVVRVDTEVDVAKMAGQGAADTKPRLGEEVPMRAIASNFDNIEGWVEATRRR